MTEITIVKNDATEGIVCVNIKYPNGSKANFTCSAFESTQNAGFIYLKDIDGAKDASGYWRYDILRLFIQK